MQIAKIFFIAFVLQTWVANGTDWGSSNATSADSYVRDACSVTRYQDLCIHSLSSFSHTAKQNPTKWARAGVSVTIGEAKNASQYLNKLKKNKIGRRRNRAALADCVECLQDAIDNLYKSLSTLRKLNARDFSSQMGDLTTWMSAALTDEDTCLDGFEDENRVKISMLRNRVLRVSYITSNALALVNKLEASGVASLIGA